MAKRPKPASLDAVSNSGQIDVYLPTIDKDIRDQLQTAVDLVKSDPTLTTRERVELLQKITVSTKNLDQGQKTRGAAPGTRLPGVIVVPAKVPLDDWSAFADEEIGRARGSD